MIGIAPRVCHILGLAAAAVLSLACAPTPAQAAKDQSCIVIDSDVDLDDFRAVAALAPTHRVAVVLVTEGISRASEGAGAMEAFLARGGSSIRVLPGATPSPRRKSEIDRDLPKWRSNAERLNGLLPAPVAASVPPSADWMALLRDNTADCPRITLLVIGPWTSFMRYAPELLDRVDRIIAQGRPDPDEIGGEPAGFNCTYDLDSCLAAFDLLVGRRQRKERHLKAEWVDIPGSPTACGSAEPGIDAAGQRNFAFRPTEAWVYDLQHAGGMAGVVAKVLAANPDGWRRTSLWDDLTALFLLRPALFVARGGHLEPCVPAATIRRLLAEAMAAR